jgi:Tfp pilus assembly protein PilV
MRPRSVRPSPKRSSSGFTLVEVLVAILLIEIGLLALMAATGIVIRETTLARARTAVLDVARNRVEMLAASPCSEVAGSTTGLSGISEDWSMHLVPIATREVRDSVTFTVQRTKHALVLHTRTPCAP